VLISDIRACQTDLGGGEDIEVIHPECAPQVCEVKSRVQAQPAWVHKRQVLLDKTDLLL